MPDAGWMARHLNTKLNHPPNPPIKFRAMTYGPIANISHGRTSFSIPVADPTIYDFPNQVGTVTRPADLASFYKLPGVASREAFNTTQEAIDELATVN